MKPDFLTDDQWLKLNFFVKNTLEHDYSMLINVTPIKIVTGFAGLDKIEDAFAIRFFPEESIVEWCEDKITADMHRFLHEENMNNVYRHITLERNVVGDKIRYGIIYSGDSP